jgi:hypothetical protein
VEAKSPLGIPADADRETLAVYRETRAVRPATHAVFGEKYVRGLETPDQLKLTSSQARLGTIAGLIERVLEERKVVSYKNAWVHRAFAFFACGLALVVLEVSVLAGKL